MVEEGGPEGQVTDKETRSLEQQIISARQGDLEIESLSNRREGQTLSFRGQTVQASAADSKLAGTSGVEPQFMSQPHSRYGEQQFYQDTLFHKPTSPAIPVSSAMNTGVPNVKLQPSEQTAPTYSNAQISDFSTATQSKRTLFSTQSCSSNVNSVLQAPPQLVFQPGVGFTVSETSTYKSTFNNKEPNGALLANQATNSFLLQGNEMASAGGYLAPEFAFEAPRKSIGRTQSNRTALLNARKARLIRFSKNHLLQLLQTFPHLKCKADLCSCHRHPGSMLWGHVTDCSADRCYVYQCESTKAVLRHYSKCSSPLCTVCTPTRIKLDLIDKETLLKWSFEQDAASFGGKRKRDEESKGPRRKFDEAAFKVGSKPFVGNDSIYKKKRID